MCAFAVGGGSQAAQTVVGKLIAPYRAFVACLPSHAADVAAILRCTAARVIVQVLRQLAPADACQPAADIVIVRLLVGCAAVKALRLHPAQFVVRAACQRNFGIAVQLVLRRGQTARMVVCIRIGLRLRRLPACRMHMPPLHRVADKVVGNVFHVGTAQMVRAPCLDDAPAVVVIISRVVVSCHARCVQPCRDRTRQQALVAARIAGAVARRGSGIIQRRGDAVLADERIVIVEVHAVKCHVIQRHARNRMAVQAVHGIRALRGRHRVDERAVVVIERVLAGARQQDATEHVGNRERPLAPLTLLAVL